jgi:hypothetical protein
MYTTQDNGSKLFDRLAVQDDAMDGFVYDR